MLPHPPLAECYLFLGACATLGFALVVQVFTTGYFGLVHQVTCAVVALRESESDTSRMNKGGIYVIEDIQNLEKDKKAYKKLHDNLTIIDNRQVNNRWDDILLVYKF